MRRILIDLARHKLSDRRGGGRPRCELSDADRVTVPISDELLDLDDALTRLSAVDPQAAELVKLRVFAGMTVEEAAALQGVSSRTAKRNWAYARAWLGRELAANSLAPGLSVIEEVADFPGIRGPRFAPISHY